MAETTGWDSPWAVRVIGLVTSLILLVVVLAGVKWVVKLQLLLLAILMLSVLDFLVGTFAHTDYGKYWKWHMYGYERSVCYANYHAWCETVGCLNYGTCFGNTDKIC